MFKFVLRGAILAAAACSLVACASAPAPYHGFGDPMSGALVSKNPYVDGGVLTASDYQVANTLVNKCNQDYKRTSAGALETIVTAGVANGIASGVGTYFGSGFITGAVKGQYGPYAAVPGTLSGAVQGAQIASTGKIGTVISCASVHSQHPAVRRIANGVAIVPMYGTRSKNTSKGPPSWVKPAAQGYQQRPVGQLAPPEAAPIGDENDVFVPPSGYN
ncbi:MAG TPA: hypothetical protein VHO23_00140 [Candidatus Paceibacterota bacterium]|nr:hypothetical protein [Candidatus Paceibacterota bacterium]